MRYLPSIADLIASERSEEKDYSVPVKGPARHRVQTRSEIDRANTIKRLNQNAKRKAMGIDPIRYRKRFGGYRIPSGY